MKANSNYTDTSTANPKYVGEVSCASNPLIENALNLNRRINGALTELERVRAVALNPNPCNEGSCQAEGDTIEQLTVNSLTVVAQLESVIADLSTRIGVKQVTDNKRR